MEHYYWLALRSVPLVGNVAFRRLVGQFGSPQSVLECGERELVASGIVPPAVAAMIVRHDYRSFVDSECRAIEKCGARVIDFQSPAYPPLLREISDTPPFLYVRGELDTKSPAVAIVGSRRATPYGVQATGRISAELAEQGVTVVSGMARGIDTAAHKGALGAGGASIGVLGCGIDVVYPSENRKLFEEMAVRGALVSEFPTGTGPLSGNFPRRNRIISGLSLGVLVVEAAEKSGSLITARFALEQGRDVYAIPGAITSPASRGCNSLIKQGAKLVETTADILEELPAAGTNRHLPQQPKLQLTQGEERLYTLLAEGPMQIDDLAGRAGLTVQELSVILLRLELQGIVIQLPGKIFSPA